MILYSKTNSQKVTQSPMASSLWHYDLEPDLNPRLFGYTDSALINSIT